MGVSVKVVNLHGTRYILEGDEEAAFRLIGVGKARMGQMEMSRMGRRNMRSRLNMSDGAFVVTEMSGRIRQCRIYAPPAVSAGKDEKQAGSTYRVSIALHAYNEAGGFRGLVVCKENSFDFDRFLPVESFIAELPPFQDRGALDVEFVPGVVCVMCRGSKAEARIEWTDSFCDSLSQYTEYCAGPVLFSGGDYAVYETFYGRHGRSVMRKPDGEALDGEQLMMPGGAYTDRNYEVWATIYDEGHPPCPGGMQEYKRTLSPLTEYYVVRTDYTTGVVRTTGTNAWDQAAALYEQDDGSVAGAYFGADSSIGNTLEHSFSFCPGPGGGPDIIGPNSSIPGNYDTDDADLFVINGEEFVLNRRSMAFTAIPYSLEYSCSVLLGEELMPGRIIRRSKFPRVCYFPEHEELFVASTYHEDMFPYGTDYINHYEYWQKTGMGDFVYRAFECEPYEGKHLLPGIKGINGEDLYGWGFFRLLRKPQEDWKVK